MALDYYDADRKMGSGETKNFNEEDKDIIALKQ